MLVPHRGAGSPQGSQVSSWVPAPLKVQAAGVADTLQGCQVPSEDLVLLMGAGSPQGTGSRGC